MNRRLLTITIALMVIFLYSDLVAAQGCGSFEYRLTATTKGSTLERELNELAKQGFRFEKESQAIGISTFTTLASRPFGTTPAQRYEYKTFNLGQFTKQKKELSLQGYVFRAAMLPSGFTVGASSSVFLLEREIGAEAGRYEYDVIASSAEATAQKEIQDACVQGFVPVSLAGGSGRFMILMARDPRGS